MKLLVFGFLIILAMNGMDKCDQEMEGSMVNLDEAFELELNKAVVVKEAKIGITFSNMQEGRCPLEVSCIQAGVARITLQLSDGEDTENLLLEAQGLCHEEDGSCGEAKSGMGYKVKLISVSPYPGSDAARNKEVVKATLVVSKK